MKSLLKTLPDSAAPGTRAALYLRVSTNRQVDNDLSIPDQRQQAAAFCKARGWEVAAEFVDAGLSGTDENRPELQRLLELATGGGAPFDVVVVHSFSRFARDHFALEHSVRRLRKHGVRLVSITQDLGDDPMSVMVRQVFALFDEYQSKENAKHVLRAMKENARQGFWNGAAAPYGYAVVAAEQRGAKTKEDKPETEQIVVPVDPIIEPAQFDAVQARLKARNPKTTPPRVVSGPILLTGLATCASCGGGMMLRTGKSGRYRYYTCATCAVQGKGACKGRSVPMDRLDKLVTDRLAETLFTPDRVKAILTGLLERQNARSVDHTQRMNALQNKVADAQGRLSRLYQAIETGIVDLGDDTLKARVAALKSERDQAKAALERAFAELCPETRITEEKIDAFTRLMRENVTHGAIPFRRAYLRAVIDQVEVDDDEVRIHGRRDVLEHLVMSGTAAAAVPSFVRKWRTRQDSNFLLTIEITV